MNTPTLARGSLLRLSVATICLHALGLGAVWCGVYPREPRMEGLRRLVGLPESVVAHSLVVLGYPGEQVPPENRYRADRVRHNRW